MKWTFCHTRTEWELDPHLDKALRSLRPSLRTELEHRLTQILYQIDDHIENWPYEEPTTLELYMSASNVTLTRNATIYIAKVVSDYLRSTDAMAVCEDVCIPQTIQNKELHLVHVHVTLRPLGIEDL